MAQHPSPLKMYIEYTGKESNFDKSNADNTSYQNYTNRFWVNAGVGVGTPGPSLIVSSSYQFWDFNLLSLRGALNGGFFNDELWDIGFMYGVATTANKYHASISAGVAIMGGTRDSGNFFSSSEKFSSRLSLPIEIQLFRRPLRFIGFGLYSFANINTEQLFAGIGVSIQLGKLR